MMNSNPFHIARSDVALPSIARTNTAPPRGDQIQRQQPFASPYERQKADLLHRQRNQQAGQFLGRRPLVIIGDDIVVSAYNKVDPVNNATVYQYHRGPFVTNYVTYHGEELFCKFSEPVTPTYDGDCINVEVVGTDDPVEVTNDTGATISVSPYICAVQMEPVFADWDPTTLCFNNAPCNQTALTNIDRYIVDAAHRNIFEMLIQQMTIGKTLKFGTYEEFYPGPGVPDPTYRTLIRRSTFNPNFPSLGSVALMDARFATQIVASPAPTNTSFKTSQTWRNDMLIDDFPVGWMVVRASIAALPNSAFVGQKGIVTAYNASTNVFTVDGFTDAFATNERIWLLPKIYGVRFWLRSGINNVALDPVVDQLMLRWPGVTEVKVRL